MSEGSLRNDFRHLDRPADATGITRDSDRTTRRGFLETAATSVAVSIGLLGGCTGGAEPKTITGTEYPIIHEWLTGGGSDDNVADDTYDGHILDRRGETEVRIDVGVQGNGGMYAYDPSAVAVSSGTTVRWVWVDDQEGHGVVADPDKQLGESDYTFDSGGPIAEEGHEFTQTFDRAGIALYHCNGISGAHWSLSRPSHGGYRAADPGLRFTPERVGAIGGGERVRGGGGLHLEPHRSLGMKGGIAVIE